MSMKTLFQILLFAALFFGGTAKAVLAQDAADSAEGYFHMAAHHFIDNEIEPAKTAVNAGLQLQPNDPKLLALKAEIEKQEEQNAQNQNQESQNSESEGEEEEQEQDSDQQQEQDPDNEQEGSSQEQEDSQQEGQQGNQQESSESQEEESQPSEEEPADPTELSKEQAERILQALQNEEGKLLREVRKVKGRPRRVEKDW